MGGLDVSCKPVCDNIVFQNGDTTLNFTLQNCDGTPFNISSATEIAVYFPTVVNPPVILRLSMSQVTVLNGGGGGQFSCVMSKTNAALLQQGSISVEVRVTIGGETQVVQFPNALTVDPSLFPGY